MGSNDPPKTPTRIIEVPAFAAPSRGPCPEAGSEPWPTGGRSLSVPRLTVHLLGSPRMTADGQPWIFAAPPGCLALLGFLALRRQPASRAAVAATLWPDQPDDEARANLRRHVHRLKRALPPAGDAEWLLDERGGLAWNHDAAPVDVALFLAGIDDRQPTAETVELYRGDLLEGYEDEWLIVERERLRARYLDALRNLCAARRRSRDFAAAIRYAERLLAHDDLREDALRELMAARYEEGDRSAALATYERFAWRLRETLDVDPMPETVALRDAIVAGLPLQDAQAPEVGADAFSRGLRDTAFVGRRTELDALQRAWTRAARGFGGTVLIAGDAGMGKSRLVAEFTAVVERQGGRVLVGATAQPESAPYQPLIAAAQRGLPALGRETLDAVWASALTGVLPEIRAIRPDLGVAETLDANRARLRLHEALARYFETIARGRPLVLVLEDLHWAGPDTIEAIEGLARRATGAPLLLLGTYRSDDGETSRGVRALARRLQSEQRAVRTVLGPLRPAEIGDLIAHTPVFERAPDELAVAVARLSEGNPLFAWQLLRSYEETDVIPDADGAVRTVGAAILTRIERLAPDARAVAEAAATVGRSFTVEFVAVAGGWTEAFVRDGLEELLQRHLVHASSGDGETYAFAHALIATAVYAAIDAAVVRPRHRRLARLLGELDAPDSTTLGVQARHSDLAGDRDSAYRAYMRAADAATAVYARDEAAAYARRAAELSDGDAERYAALAIALHTTLRTGEVARTKADLVQFEQLASRLGDGERFAALEAWSEYLAHVGDAVAHARVVAAMFALADAAGYERRRIAALEAQSYMLMVSGRIAETEPLLNRAALLAERIGDGALRARVSVRLGQIQIRLGKGATALETLRHRRVVLSASSTPVEWLELLAAEINCAFVLEEMEIGERAAVELLALAQRVGDLESEGKAHGTLSYVAHSRGDAAGMREHSDRAVEVFERIGHGRALQVTLLNRGTLEFELGRIDDALRFWDGSARFAERIGSRDGLATAAINQAEAELLRERFEVAERIARGALAIARENGEGRHVAEALVVSGAANSALGKNDEGVRDLRAGIALRREIGGQRSLPHELCFLMEALLRAGDLASARETADELAACDVAAAKYPARVHLVLSRFWRAAGDVAAAKRHANEGRSVLRRRLAELSPPDAKAYRALPFSRALLSSSALP
jgi:DNA-binding SARP family transcriptional activator